jgi:putative ABC transport system permease protein
MLGNLTYNLKLAFKNIRRNPGLSVLMVAAIGVGIGASMSMITVNYRFSMNPIPAKSDELFFVRLDWPVEPGAERQDDVPDQLTYRDATALLAAKRAYRQAAMSQSTLAIEPPGNAEGPFFVPVRATTADFFALFETPFAYGRGWTAEADTAAEQVAVLSARVNERVFGGRDSVGQTVTLSGRNYRVVGVLDEWRPLPKFYDVTSGALDETEGVFLPWSLIVANDLPRSGNTQCFTPPPGRDLQGLLASECIWVQFWVELRNASERGDYAAFLAAYTAEQQELGRFPSALPHDNRLSDVLAWLNERNNVPSEAQVLLGLSFLFLVVCLLNTIGLLLAKFLGKASEIGIRRALGASRRVLFQQYLVEAGMIGIAGGAFGLFCTWLGLKGIRMQIDQPNVDVILSMDWKMALAAVALAIGASIVTAIYPTWRACNVQPAAYLGAN